MLPTLQRTLETPFDMLNTELDRVWRSFSDESGRRTGIFPVDVREENDELVVDAELPGFTKDQIDVNIDRDVLSIVADRSSEKTAKPEQDNGNGNDDDGEVIEPKARHYISERRQTRVARRFQLPFPVDSEHIEAKYNDGVLTLHLPKQESAKPRKVAVK